MFLHEDIAHFKETRSLRLLRHILEKHGKHGFNFACREARLSRSKAKRLLGLTTGFEQAHEVAVKSIGIQQVKDMTDTPKSRLPGSFESNKR